ncbi:MAG: hypothetical protein ACR2KY_05715 [Thermoleophilaceae bacterium]|jgi:hypothetical protein
MNEQETGPGGRQPTEEELRAAMEEQMKRIRVEDVLLQTVATLVNLGGRRLGLAPEAQDERDLDQARLAIEATRALTPLLGPEEERAVREALSQLQVAFAREAGGAEARTGQAAAGASSTPPSPSTGTSSAGEPPKRGAEPQPTPDEVERAKARSKIWTPGR